MTSSSSVWRAIPLLGNAFFILGVSATAETTDNTAATGNATPIDFSAIELGPSVTEEWDGILSITSSGNAAGPFRLIELTKPDIDFESFAIKGEIRYENIESEGYLELWTFLATSEGSDTAEEQFFTRTLAPYGPMAKLSGTIDEWREFQMPAIVNDDSGRRPTKLVLNVSLPGSGSVQIRNLSLVQPYSQDTTPLRESPLSWLPTRWSPLNFLTCGALLGSITTIWWIALWKRRTNRETPKA